MTELAPATVPAQPGGHVGRPPGTTSASRLPGWVPSWAMITTRQLELRKRRGLMIAVIVLTVGLTVLFLGVRLLFHAFDPATYGPAGNPGIFSAVTGLIAEFGFIVAAALGASAGTTDLTDGMFRHLVITGRSRLALYLARIPAGLGIALPLVAVAFTMVCLVTSFAGTPDAKTVQFGSAFVSGRGPQVVRSVSVPGQLDETQLGAWALAHPQQAEVAFPSGSTSVPASQLRSVIDRQLPTIYSAYVSAEIQVTNPPINEMIKIGLWLELDIGVGFLVGLGLGSLMGQRMVPTVLLIVLQIIITPLLASHVLPYFLDGQRLVFGIAMNQLRPAWLLGGNSGGLIRSGGPGALQLPPMPTWAMVSVIVGWAVGWTGLGAWRMMTRDA